MSRKSQEFILMHEEVEWRIINCMNIISILLQNFMPARKIAMAANRNNILANF